MQIIEGDCLEKLVEIPDQSIDAIITDPPYAEIKKDYGKWTESEWHELMDRVVEHSKRVLKPSGSAVFIVQPNFENIGKMRLWVWEFLVRTAKNWNLIQNVYWWNHAAMPTAGCMRSNGLMRSSVKYLLWFGAPNCYRNQDAILWEPSHWAKAMDLEDRALRNHYPSGVSKNTGRMAATVQERGGSTPFNLIPLSNTNSNSSEHFGHGASTPIKLAEWLIKYLTKEGDLILDMFAGVATIGVAAKELKRDYIGIEKDVGYVKSCRLRLNLE